MTRGATAGSGSPGGANLGAGATAHDVTNRAGVNVWRGLLWKEWLAHRSLLVNALVAWLIGGWVLLIFFHPGFILGFGVIYAFLAGPAFGGAEAVEGSEEFAFSLPPTRSQRYLARLLLGGGPVLAFTVLGVLAIAFNLPQRVWGLVVNSGFTEPFDRCEQGFLYPLAVAVPVAAFAFAFALASAATTRALVATAWFFGGLIAGAVLGLAFISETLLWRELNGYLAIPALFAVSPLAILAGYLRYVRKEGIARPRPVEARGRAWLWAVVVVGVLVLGLMFLLPSYRYARRREEVRHRDEARHAVEAAGRRALAEPRIPAPAPALDTRPASTAGSTGRGE